MLNILATPHRERAVALASHMLTIPSSAPLDQDPKLAAKFPDLTDHHVRGAMCEVQRRADASAAATRAKTAQLVANAIDATAQWIEAKMREQADTDLASEIADWLEVGGHSRPFWRDPEFVAEFGAVRRVDLAAAVAEMKSRAIAKAAATPMPLIWPARPNTNLEG